MRNVNKVGLVGLTIAGIGSLVGGCTGNDLVDYMGLKAAHYAVKKDIEMNGELGILIRRWNDDGDGKIEKGEILGEVYDSVMRDMGICFYMNSLSFRKDIGYTLLKKNEILDDITENKVVCKRNCPNGGFYLPKGSLSEGTYIIVAQKGRIRKFREFVVTR
jgi:hypothetical protein